MAFKVGAIIAELKADISNFQSGMTKATGVTKELTSKTNDVNKSLGDFAKKAVAAVAALQVGAKMVSFFNESSKAANEYSKAMTTLEIMSGRFGVSAEDAQNTAKELGQELRIGTGSAANALQNLLKGGLGLEESKDLLQRFTNEALTGKASTLSLSQAVENLSFAYATNNSAIGNLSGINENFQDIIKNGEEALLNEGVALEDITEDAAKYRGMIDLTNLTMGSAEKFTGTLIDKQATLGLKMEELKIAVGEGVNPAISAFIDLIINSGIIDRLTDFFVKIAEISTGTIDLKTGLENLGIPIGDIITFLENLKLKMDVFIKEGTEVLKGKIEDLTEAYQEHKKTIDTIVTTLTVFFLPAIIKVGIESAIAGGLVVANFIASIIKIGIESVITGAKMAVSLIFNIVKVGVQAGIAAAVGMANLIISTIKWGLEGWKTIAMLGMQIIKMGIATAAFIFQTGVIIAQTAATIAATAATWLFNAALAVLTSPITLIILAIGALIAIGVLLVKNWDQIKEFGTKMLEDLKGKFEGFVTKLNEVGGKILDAIMWPFNEAKKKVEEAVSFIKDRLDFTKRHSPSVIDILNKGVSLANKAIDGLDFNLNGEINHQTIGAGVASGATGIGAISLNLDLNGAIISSDLAAQEFSEIVGDNIIRKLQANIRV